MKRPFNEERIVCSTSYARTTGANSKNFRKIIKVNLDNLGFGNDFIVITPKAKRTKGKARLIGIY